MQIGSTQQLARASVRTPFVAAPSQLARSRQTFAVRAEQQDTRDRGARKLDEDSYQSAHPWPRIHTAATVTVSASEGCKSTTQHTIRLLEQALSQPCSSFVAGRVTNEFADA